MQVPVPYPRRVTDCLAVFGNCRVSTFTVKLIYQKNCGSQGIIQLISIQFSGQGI